MANERWNSPFPHTLAYNFFKKHFTELNKIYWANVPASNTIQSIAKKELKDDKADPKTFFLIPDEEDRRIAPSYEEWKTDYREFLNYTRLNMVMLISSCFETYLRTIVSNAFESKPGVIIMAPDSVDGIFLLKDKANYGNMNDKNYRYEKEVDEICRGEWNNRIMAFEKYFGKVPNAICEKICELDRLRIIRNNIAHYIGRNKKDYSAPNFIAPHEAIRVSHNQILKYLKLIGKVALEFDNYLKVNYIGSYDIIKLYFNLISQGEISSKMPGERARQLQRYLGREGLPSAGNEYYRNIVNYYDLDNQNELCRYSKKACIIEINRQLKEKGKELQRNGKNVRFNGYHFSLFIKSYGWKSDPELCVKNFANNVQNEYIYSSKLINKIVSLIENNCKTIIDELKNNELEF